MLALAAAALTLAAVAHPGYGDGTCVDVTIDGVTTADTLCPVADDLAVRTISAKGRTVYFGITGQPLTLTFRRKTVKAPSGPYAVEGEPVLGAIRAGKRHRTVDVFGLPGKQATVLGLTDEVNRRVRLRVAAPTGRRLCSGLQIAGAVTPGRVLCRTGARAFQVRFSADCKHHRQLIYGLAPTRITRARAVLTNGRTSAVKVTRVPRSVGSPAVVLTARRTGTLASKVRGYDAAGKLLATASLGGCT